MSPMDTPLQPIPELTRYPLLGNLPQLARGNSPLESFIDIAREKGPIVRFRMPDSQFLLVSDHALIQELCDGSRFEKAVFRPQRALRGFAGDGLFTAYNDEPNWALAHRILLPAFGGGAMKRYLPDMLSSCRDLVDRWQQIGPDTDLDVNKDMTALTLDIIGTCGFGYPFNMIQRQAPHPFVEALNNALLETQASMGRPDVINALHFGSRRRLENATDQLFRTVDDIIRARREALDSSEDARDLLSLMLQATDPKTGERLSDENVRYQIITFLVAGHETTSGMLAWTLHLLSQHPEIQKRAADEVLSVLGDDPARVPTMADLSRLKYLKQILCESLRLYPTAPVFSRASKQGPQTLGGKYSLAAGEEAMVLVWFLHRDPEVWGADAETFDPDRFAPEAARKRPFTAWLPFGYGARACIGRQFAMTEGILALALLLQRFELVGKPGFHPPLQSALTIKPGGLTVRALPRGSRQSVVTQPGTSSPIPDLPSSAPSCPFQSRQGHSLQPTG